MQGTTPLHVAAEARAAEVWAVLIRSGADASLKDKFGRTAVALASLCGGTMDASGLYLQPVAERKKTAILTDATFLQHHTCDPGEASTSIHAPPENIHRLTVLVDALNGVLRSEDLAEGLDFVDSTPKASLADVLRVHDWSYVRKIEAACEALESRSEGADEEEEELGRLDGDTAISRRSYDAALHAAVEAYSSFIMTLLVLMKNNYCSRAPYAELWISSWTARMQPRARSVRSDPRVTTLGTTILNSLIASPLSFLLFCLQPQGCGDGGGGRTRQSWLLLAKQYCHWSLLRHAHAQVRH